MTRNRSGYRLSHQAEADLENIFAYTVRTWSIRQANRYLAQIEEALEALASGAKTGRPRPEIGTDYLTQGVGSHFIVYRHAGETVVARILHQSMDLTRHLS